MWDEGLFPTFRIVHVLIGKSACVKMSLVEVDSRYRVTLTSDVRRFLGVKKGQRVYVVPRGDAFVVIPLKEDIDAELHKLIGDVKFDRAARRKAEAFLFKQAR